ncbi:hypothetical protein S245_019860, partial [Arachis hypogaea]
NPEEAHARRGAPWTFNPSRLLACFKNLKIHGFVYVPSFDHGVGDPVEDDIFVNIQYVVGFSDALNGGYESWGPLFGKVFFAFWVFFICIQLSIPQRSHGSPEQNTNHCYTLHEFVQEHFKRKKTNTVNGRNGNPSFKIRIQESYVGSSCVAIPATFARKHLEEGPIRMNVGNRTWTVCYKTWRGSDRYRKHKLQSGWLRFRRENNLEVGDVCVFELISKFPQTMTMRLQSG